MKKLILIGIGLVAATAFIGFDAAHAWTKKARQEIRATLMSPEMELEGQLSSARELAEKCAESVIHGKVALARLDSLLEERSRELARRERLLDRDRTVLETRRDLLRQSRGAYLIGGEEVSRRTLNRDAVLRAKAFATDRDVVTHLDATIAELTMQRAQVAMEIEEATAEQVRLDGEIQGLEAQLETLKARKAVAQTREESKYVFDRSAFDEARDKIATIRATIAEQNKRLDFFGRRGNGARGLVPAGIEAETENGLDAIASVLSGSEEELVEDVPAAEAVALTR